MSRRYHVAALAAVLALLCGVANAGEPAKLPANTTPSPTATPHAGSIEWSDAEVLARLRGATGHPVVRSDGTGGLHAVFAASFPLSSPPEHTNGLAYQRHVAGRWSAPRAITRGNLEESVDAVDLSYSDRGWLHAVWRGRDQRIEYQSAHVSRSSDPDEWGRYRRLTGPGATGASIRTSSGGIVHVAWSDLRGRVTYLRMERDGLDTSEPSPLFEPVPNREAANRPVLAIDRHGRVHAAWAVHGPAPQWLPHTILHRRSLDGGATWRQDVPIATGPVYDPVLVALPAEMISLWSEEPSVGRRMYSVSTDGGRSWSDPVEIDERLRGGLYGPVATAVDSNGTLHAILSTGSRILHVSRTDGSWADSISVVDHDRDATAHFDRLSATVAEGNLLHVVTRHGDAVRGYRADTGSPPRAGAPIPAPQSPTLVDRLAATSLPLRLLFLFLALFVIAMLAEAVRRSDRPAWMFWMPAALVACAAALLGRWPEPAIDAVTAGLLLLACTARPALGLVALIAASAISPWTLETGTETSLSIVIPLVFVLCVIWLVTSLRRRDFTTLATGPVVALAGLTGVAAIALVAVNKGWLTVAALAPLPAQLGGLAVFALSAAAFVLAADWNRDERDLRWLTVAYLIAFSLALSDWLIPELDFLGRRLRPPGTDSSLTWTWLVALAFGQAGFNRRLDWQVRCLLALLICLVLVRGFLATPVWISGWLPPALALFAAFAFGKPRLAAGLLVVTSIAAAFLFPAIESFVSRGDNPYSLGTRLDAWKILGDIVAEHPIVGSGPANYYFLTPAYEIRGYAVPFSSHNNYIDVAAQTGALGLLCFLAFVVTLGRRFWSLRGRCGDGFANGYLVGAAGGFAGTLAAGMLGDWIFPFVYNVGLDGLRASLPAWLLLGGVLALQRIAAAGERPVSSRGESDRAAKRSNTQTNPRPAKITSTASTGRR